jgi:VIT1/CCC1 family predicted Fe2+/Mn2+ transporter
MGLVMLAFVVGAVIPLVAYFFVPDRMTGLAISTVLALAGLFTAGSVKNATAGLAWWKGGVEMLLLGGVAALITYGVGLLFHVSA